MTKINRGIQESVIRRVAWILTPINTRRQPPAASAQRPQRRPRRAPKPMSTALSPAAIETAKASIARPTEIPNRFSGLHQIPPR